MTAACSAAECDRPAAHRDMCPSHYQMAWRVHGEAWKAERDATRGDCSVEDCEKPARKRGWCHMHYQRWRQHGDVNHGRVIDPLCVRCNAEKHRDTSGKLYCKPCAATSGVDYRARNADRLRAQARERHERNRDKDNARSQARYRANPDKFNAQVREWQLANPDRRRQYARAWYERNKATAHGHVALRRARLLGAVCAHGPGCVTGDLLKSVKTQMCVYCGNAGEHADHYIPITRGGLHCRENIVPACGPCNWSKNNRLPDEWKRAVS